MLMYKNSTAFCLLAIYNILLLVFIHLVKAEDGGLYFTLNLQVYGFKQSKLGPASGMWLKWLDFTGLTVVLEFRSSSLKTTPIPCASMPKVMRGGDGGKRIAV